jgi:hypothetical protein
LNQDLPVACGVSARQGHPKSPGGPLHPGQKAIQPPPRSRFRKRQTQQEASRNPAHRGDIARRARQRLIPNGPGRVLFSMKVHSFEECIAGHKELLIPGWPKNRSVVTHTETHKPPMRADSPLNPGD